MGQLDNKVAIVTGAGSGIGEAIAKRYGEEGAKVVMVDLNEENGKEAEGKLKEAGLEVTFMQADVTEEARAQEIIDETIKLYGGLDIMVNNAGIDIYKPTEELTYDEFKRVIGVNLNAPFIWSKLAIMKMLDKEEGIVINMSSMDYIKTVPGNCSYDASKGGIIQLTRSLAHEYAARGIRINAISPGYIDTPILPMETRDINVQMTPMNRIGDPSEIASVAVFLATDESSFMTGANVVVDGGCTVV